MFAVPCSVKEFEDLSEAQKAIVTGASGLIGSSLVEHLVSTGADVVAIDKVPPDARGARVVELDLCTRGGISQWLSPDTIVYHLAASANVGASVTDPRNDFNNTFGVLFEILESARAVGAHVIFPSSASVYDPEAPLPLDERAPKRPSSPYGAAKLAGEAYCIAYHRSYGLDIRIARMFSVYGPRMKRLAIHDIIRRLERNQSQVDILGDGTQIRDYLHVRDAARGLSMIATAGSPGEDYNLASGTPVTVLELTRTIARLMDCPDAIIRPTGQSFAGDTPRWYASTAKINGIGFEPSIPLEIGLEETIAGVRARSPEHNLT
jgi:UDP-glucose 4-epimerase